VAGLCSSLLLLLLSPHLLAALNVHERRVQHNRRCMRHRSRKQAFEMLQVRLACLFTEQLQE
jgi:hypothetical protein